MVGTGYLSLIERYAFCMTLRVLTHKVIVALSRGVHHATRGIHTLQLVI
jgi:hypothetical protein